MKKIIAILLACLMLLTFAACNSDKDKNENGGESSGAPSQSQTPGDTEGSGSSEGDGSEFESDSKELPTVIAMSDAEKKEIENAWLSRSGEKLTWFDVNSDKNEYTATRYYGMFGDDYYVIFKYIGWDMDGECVFKVGDYSFKHSELFEIYAYKDDVFYEIDGLYKEGKLHFAEVMILSDIHKGYESYFGK